MITIAIDTIEFKFPENWEEITIREMVEINTRIKGRAMPESMRVFTEEADIDKRLTYLDTVNDFEQWALYRAFEAGCWAKIPDELIERIALEDTEALYSIMQKMMAKVEVIENCKDFNYKGEKWVMPEIEEISILGQTENQPKITVGEFAKAMGFEKMVDKLKRDDIESMAGLMAMFCRKPGEDFSNNLLFDRIEFWMDAPMNLAFQVSFFFGCASRELRKSSKDFGPGDGLTRISGQAQKPYPRHSVGRQLLTRLQRVVGLTAQA